ncbi:TPR-like protein [Sodiomyces alkalinus F11]|uniref:TPR-like protein n=1 Tax=Sodiomyces alkalinus (strain CBS 110278 / VKM F-3762 / F11) TaxID=1314773 RepID=A0A3N2PWG9_SODAK|nr:TPR-like protein [Sodiomyces alkalinus F11]ROT38863.1 TPR-like protein [Sodiomyces alkalinus F11]
MGKRVDARPRISTPYHLMDRSNAWTWNAGGDRLPTYDDVVSDADSDELEIRSENERFEQSVQAFLASYQDQDGDRPAAQRRRGRRSGRGPGRPSLTEAEPRGDIKLRLAQVNRAFLNGDYNESERRIHEIIRINAETHQAWVTLATICEEQGRDTDALTAKLYASHLRPKDAEGWLGCAALALHIAGDDNQSPALKTAGTCFASAVLADPTSVKARLGRAEFNHRRGHLAKAIRDYIIVLERHPCDISVVRKLAEVCEASRSPEHVGKAVAAYQRYFSYLKTGALSDDLGLFWGDISIYVELLACVGDYSKAITEIGILARWLLRREDENIWEEWLEDDREWDLENTRRLEVPGFKPSHSPSLYGLGLPMELRARLGLYRLKLGDVEESKRHLSWLDPTESATAAAVEDFPGLIRDIADTLFDSGNVARALDYYELIRNSIYGEDPDLLLRLGRCHLANFDTGAAEDCFLLTIQVDEKNIDARIELARIYEQAKEGEEALILITEAIALRGAGNGVRRSGKSAAIPLAMPSNLDSPEDGHAGQKAGSGAVVRPRYRPKRLVAPDQRRQEEHKRADELSRKYQDVRNLKREIRHGARHLVSSWMAAAKDLVDDFRSFRRFYTWDKYVKYLGAADDMVLSTPLQTRGGHGNSELHELAERLSKNVATGTEARRDNPPPNDDGHRGIPFGDWLELFLDYAISLALCGRGEEAHQVCEAARDSIVFTDSKDYMFLIHVAWAACAVYLGDEEMCVAMARYFTKVHHLDSDSYRMFAALCRLCQSPASWYNSGPVQKYILRQIRLIDTTQLQRDPRESQVVGCNRNTATQDDRRNLDVCLLTLYGHILFTSTSYTFALNYFLRAKSLDPGNPMVNLSVGLGYVHHGLKRQSENRQYLIMQGLSCIFQYLASRSAGTEGERAAACYVLARVFHILGLHHLANSWYNRGLEDSVPETCGATSTRDTRCFTAFNKFLLLVTSGNLKDIDPLLSSSLLL